MLPLHLVSLRYNGLYKKSSPKTLRSKFSENQEVMKFSRVISQVSLFKRETFISLSKVLESIFRFNLYYHMCFQLILLYTVAALNLIIKRKTEDLKK